MSTLGAQAQERFHDPSIYLHKDFGVDVRKRLVADLLRPSPPRRILDVGCGDGRVSLQFLPSARITLLDSSPAMLGRASERVRREDAARVEIVAADVLTLAPAEPFDTVLCLGLLAHVDSPRDVIDTLIRCTAAGGRIVLQFTDAGRPAGRLHLWRDRVKAAAGSRHGYAPQPFRFREMRRLLEGKGLRIEATRRCGVTIPGAGFLPNGLLREVEYFSARTGIARAVGADVLVLLRTPLDDAGQRERGAGEGARG